MKASVHTQVCTTVQEETEKKGSRLFIHFATAIIFSLSFDLIKLLIMFVKTYHVMLFYFFIYIYCRSPKNNNVQENAVSKIPLLTARHKRREKEREKGKENVSVAPRCDLMKTTTLVIHPVEEKTQKVSKQQSRKNVPKGKKSSVLIKNYRAGYTWNRGGRLKELRIR